MIIYKAINRINGKEYVGQTTRSLSLRIAEHKYCSSKTIYSMPVYSAMVKYGFENFDFFFIDSASSMEELNKKEEFYIKEFNTLCPNGYNVLPGGENRTVSDETKKKISAAKKGKFVGIDSPYWGQKYTEDRCKAISNGLKGRKNSEESNKKNSESHMGEKNNFFGKKHTEETIKKMSEIKKGKKNPQTSLRMSKKVICLDTGIIYDSVKKASEQMGIKKGGIAECARGELKQTKGYRFKYL